MNKLDSLLLKFIGHMKTSGFSERSIPDYTRNVRYYLDFLKELGIENIAEADSTIITEYQLRVSLETWKGKPISAATQQSRLTCVRTFYQYLLNTKVILYDPSANIDLPKRPKTLPKEILNKKEVGKLLSEPSLENPLGIRDRAILELFYATGIRVSELCNLTLLDVDIVNGELRINKGKNAKDRIIPIGEIACDYLELYLKESRPELAPKEQKTFFVTKSGRKFRYCNLSYLISQYGKKAGVQKSTNPHALRHACATHLLKGKADIRQIQEILGHSSISTTQRYTKVDIGDLKKVIKRCHPRERREIQTYE